MTSIHWSPPDVIGDILAEASRPAAAEPVAIHVRPEIHELIHRQEQTRRCALAGAGLRLVVDQEIPAVPGYEIHRAAPPDRAAAVAGCRPARTRGTVVTARVPVPAR
jgi:hypothetical protein